MLLPIAFDARWTSVLTMNSMTIASDALSLSIRRMDQRLLLPRVFHRTLPLATDAPADIV
jgi:hypothetical protein